MFIYHSPTPPPPPPTPVVSCVDRWLGNHHSVAVPPTNYLSVYLSIYNDNPELKTRFPINFNTLPARTSPSHPIQSNPIHKRSSSRNEPRTEFKTSLLRCRCLEASDKMLRVTLEEEEWTIFISGSLLQAAAASAETDRCKTILMGWRGQDWETTWNSCPFNGKHATRFDIHSFYFGLGLFRGKDVEFLLDSQRTWKIVQ